MSVVGIQFNKIAVDKINPVKGKVSVKNNVSLKDVRSSDVKVGSASQAALKFDFEFDATYEPKIASMKLNGNVTYLESKEKVKEIEESWKKDKKIPKEVLSVVLNTVFSRCNVEALVLAREVNLPPPFQLPKVAIKE